MRSFIFVVALTVLVNSVAVAQKKPSSGSKSRAYQKKSIRKKSKLKAGWPDHAFAPYVDVTLWPPYDISTTAKEQKIKYYVLAFITASGKTPCWGGYLQYNVVDSKFHKDLKDRIQTVRKLGGDVMISFGGAAGVELASAIKDPKELQKAYQKVIDAYDLNCIDFDIEGAAVAERVTIDRRSKVIAALQKDAAKKGKKLTVWFTLPVLPAGLTHEGVSVVKSAVKHGVNIAGVNVMAMDYGDSAAPNPKGKMGYYAIQAGTNLAKQLHSIYGNRKSAKQIWKMVGITPMIGLNDVTTETFTQQDAKQLLKFSKQKSIGLISIWSLTRDRAHKDGAKKYVSAKFSSLYQQPFEFSLILNNYGNDKKKSKRRKVYGRNKK